MKTQSGGKVASRPLYVDPPGNAPTDPVLCFNAEQNKWFMYYTQRRATAVDLPGVTWVHGTSIGIAESSDGGATWSYRGLADIDYGKDKHPKDYTYWAPEVIWHAGLYHMFLTFVPGIFERWGSPAELGYLTSKDGLKWETVCRLDLESDKVIDACVMQLPSGTWRMWYKDDQKQPRALAYADSVDFKTWEPKGNAVTDFNGEGPKVINWKGTYWLICDCWDNGMRVWKSDDCTSWRLQEEALVGNHGDAVISGDRAWWFYFTNKPGGDRTTEIDVIELFVSNGKLLAGDPAQPTVIDLRSVREDEK
jgi:hypothetical protein